MLQTRRQFFGKVGIASLLASFMFVKPDPGP